jgi:hypothetical protein
VPRLLVGKAVLPAADNHRLVDDALLYPTIEGPRADAVTLRFFGQDSRRVGSLLLRTPLLPPFAERGVADRGSMFVMASIVLHL